MARKIQGNNMKTPPVVSPEEWEAARQQLLFKEKELTRARDAMAAQRRRMPWMAIERNTSSRVPRVKSAWPICSRATGNSSSIAPSSSQGYSAGPIMLAADVL